MGELSLSQSGLATWMTCRRKWFYTYKKSWRSEDSVASVFGTCWHTAMDAVWRLASAKDYTSPDDAVHFGREAFSKEWDEKHPRPLPDREWRGPEVAGAMLEAYVEKYWDELQKIELLAVEHEFHHKLGAHGIDLNGFIDKVFRDANGRLCVLDHKSTASYSKADGIKPGWWREFSMSAQVDAYLVAARAEWGEVPYFMVDAALAHKTERFFKWQPYERRKEEIDEFMGELVLHSQEIRQAERTGIYPRNPKACDSWSGCPYHPVCVRHPSPVNLPRNPPAYAKGVHVRIGRMRERKRA